MLNMFLGATALRVLTLGQDFSFIGSPAPALPAIQANDPYTGNWQNVGNGTITIPQGIYEFTSAQLMASFNGPTMADTWVWQRMPFWGIHLTGDHTFPPATVNYGAQTPHIATVTNTGNQPTGTLTVALSGANPDSFILSTTSLTSIAVGGATTFTVAPNTGLPVGTYTATVTVSGGNNIEAVFVVSFTVNAVGGGAVGGGGSDNTGNSGTPSSAITPGTTLAPAQHPSSMDTANVGNTNHNPPTGGVISTIYGGDTKATANSFGNDILFVVAIVLLLVAIGRPVCEKTKAVNRKQAENELV